MENTCGARDRDSHDRVGLVELSGGGGETAGGPGQRRGEGCNHGYPGRKIAALHKEISPYPGEYAWREDIPWEISIRAARERAAREGKPILLLSSADGPPLGKT
jgi:hypothetical protein